MRGAAFTTTFITTTSLFYFSFDFYPPPLCESVLLFVLSESRRFEIVPRPLDLSRLRDRERAVEPSAQDAPAIFGASGPRERDGERARARARTYVICCLREWAERKATQRTKTKEKKRKAKLRETTTKQETLSFLLSFSLFLGGLVCVYRTRSAPIYHCTSVLCAMRTTSGHSGWWTTPSS